MTMIPLEIDTQRGTNFPVFSDSSIIQSQQHTFNLTPKTSSLM